ncbi:hypothetical protein D4L85_33365 [Chryseolinea soli]|uniref:Uncharacterized protein n=1 Tax=Chryseolinea soli TaxID=2321403 RepID=A0A385T214_9BACT|nr:hypothetical protein D4L85_33365 [Chryseolinea soli]
MGRSQVNYFDGQFSGTFDNTAFKANGRRYGSPALLELFEIREAKADSVSVVFDRQGKLELAYQDSDGKVKTEIFEGVFVRSGYYEVFLRNERKEIPPAFPFIYSRCNINRLRLALSAQGDLIVDNEWNESGNILFLGVGDKGRRQSYFSRRQ